MTDRARLVYALLRTLLAWTPTPRAKVELAHERGFVGGNLRYVSCPDCLTNDRVLPTCETCGGRGEIPDPRPDPYELKTTRFGGLHVERKEEDARRNEVVLDQLERDRKIRDEGEAEEGFVGRMIRLRDDLYRRGSYAELERQLGWLRDRDLAAYELAMSVAYQPFGEAPVETGDRFVVALCELLALRMDGPIKVPPYVTITLDQEAEKLIREGKGALWRGHGRWHDLKRGERNALVVAMAAEGRSSRVIGLRLNLTRQHVRRILRAAEERVGGVASGPAA